ncbi:MAG: 3-phosphoshikimate 1-carboxyvinyltransferase, partial [Candidatus Izimaplasma sp.]|nr:3-phosphoshikimate 1-carboxyvinyltransferase [Candidatus Izimaplasma bacterium]
SSQFFTGLLLTLPLLEQDSTIIIKNTLESKSYVDLTIHVLKAFGVSIRETPGRYYIKGNQTYKATNFNIEGDYSQAAFFIVGATINGNLSINNLNLNSAQGDKAIIDIVTQMNGKIILMEKGYSITKSSTHGKTIDVADCPDLAPILSLLGAVSKGTTKLINIERLRLKESDRVTSTVTTLKQLGADIEANDSTITIHGKPLLKGNVTVDSFNDHRIAMMTALAAIVCEHPITLTNVTAVNKSYPTFFEDYKRLGGIYEVKE